MGVPNRQIGTASSIEEKLLQQISKQLQQLIQVVGTLTTTTTAP